jgi:hypothetical protein
LISMLAELRPSEVSVSRIPYESSFTINILIYVMTSYLDINKLSVR